ncbi:MAG: helix-turn-helix domain-containing protein [Devosia sp.]
MLSVDTGVSGPAVHHARETLQRHIFTNKEIRCSDQFECWRDTVRPIMEILPDGGETQGFAAQIEAWNLGGMAFLRSRTAPTAFRRTKIQARNAGIDHWTFTVVKTGSFQLFRPGAPQIAEPGGVFVKSMHTPMEGALGRATSLCLVVPRDVMRERVAAIDAVDEMTLSSGLPGLLADYLIDLERQLPHLDQQDLPGVLAATRAMIEACLSPTRDRIAAAGRSIDATLQERARRLITQNLLIAGFGAEEICSILGISRSRLYRLFEAKGGVVHWIRKQRLIDGHRILASPNNKRTVTSIALERNFLDPADFSRAFKREFGYSPKEARSTGGGTSPKAATHGIDSGTSLERLLLDLH